MGDFNKKIIKQGTDDSTIGNSSVIISYNCYTYDKTTADSNCFISIFCNSCLSSNITSKYTIEQKINNISFNEKFKFFNQHINGWCHVIPFMKIGEKSSFIFEEGFYTQLKDNDKTRYPTILCEITIHKYA